MLRTYRLHGGPGYSHRYTEPELARLKAMAAGTAETCYLFNNTGMYQDAWRFLALMGEQVSLSPVYPRDHGARTSMNRWEQAVPEREVAEQWQQSLAQGQILTTTAGERLEVLYPGRANGDGGPDFCDAVIVLGGERQLKGDVELHVSSSQWWQHGHHRCPSYNNVILHVVLWDDAARDSRLQNHGTASVVALGQPRTRAASIPWLPCSNTGQRLPPARLKEALDKAGEARFRDKASRFQYQMQHQDADQVLYQGLLQALGYSKNKEPFLELARALPWHRLLKETQARSDHEASLVLQALLLGQAGLLPDHQGRDQTLEETGAEAMAAAWHLARQGQPALKLAFRRDRVRPENLPVRRLAAAGLLLCRYLETGLAAGMADAVDRAAAGGRRPRLEAALEVAATGFWASYLDFGLKVKGKAPTLLGRGRAGDMMVNIVLPFVWAWASASSRPRLLARALELYRQQPRLEDNSITRHMMRQVAIERKAVVSACQQQGLLHIYKEYCTQGGCGQCKFSEV